MTLHDREYEVGVRALHDRLRGYDAVHLASALALGDAITFVSWDRELRRAAAQSGCALAPGQMA
jgi:predicted nucleic acid-binding protein